jgi:hypothetical protein
MSVTTIRAIVRPILLIIFIGMSAYFIINGMDGDVVERWHWITFGGAAEWILERPIIKIATRKA